MLLHHTTDGERMHKGLENIPGLVREEKGDVD